MGLGALARLAHRGAVGADGRTGDGAGVTTQIPFDVLRPDLNALGLAALGPGQLAVGLVFLPRAEPAAAQSQQVVARGLAANGLTVAGWRGVPVHEDALGDAARACRPQIAHVIVPRPEGVAADEFERRLYLARAGHRRARGRRRPVRPVRRFPQPPDAGLQGARAGGGPRRLLRRSPATRVRDRVRDLPPAVQHQHPALLVHDPALPRPRAQRRDQHHRRQPDLDARARAAPGRAAAGGGPGSAGADPRRRDQRFRLARRGAGAAHAVRSRPRPRDEPAHAPGLGGRCGDPGAGARALRLPGVGDGALGRARVRRVHRRPRGRARPWTATASARRATS